VRNQGLAYYLFFIQISSFDSVVTGQLKFYLYAKFNRSHGIAVLVLRRLGFHRY
jgi:hypothetical protein